MHRDSDKPEAGQSRSTLYLASSESNVCDDPYGEEAEAGASIMCRPKISMNGYPGNSISTRDSEIMIQMDMRQYSYWTNF